MTIFTKEFNDTAINTGGSLAILMNVYARPIVEKGGRKASDPSCLLRNLFLCCIRFIWGKSPLVRLITSGGTEKYANAKTVRVNKARVTLAKGKAFKVKARVVVRGKGKKLFPAKHTAKIRYLSSNKSVATVSKVGKIRGIAKGACYVYAIAHNGTCKKVKVKVS